MKLSQKQIDRLDKACRAKFGLDFHTVYKNIEADMKRKQDLKDKQKLVKKGKK